MGLRLWILGSAAGLGCAFGCGRNDGPQTTDPVSSGKSGPSSAVADTPPTPPGPAVAADPTEEECRHFGQALEASFAASDGAAVGNAIDWDALIERGLARLQLSESMRNRARRGQLSARARDAFVTPLVASPGTKRFKMLRIVGPASGERRVRVRIIADGGINYHDYLIERRGGRIRAVDVYVWTTGELASETFSHGAQGLLDATRAAGPGSLDAWTAMMAEYKAGRYGEVLNAYGRLPDAMKAERVTMLLRVRAACEVDDREFVRAVADFRGRYPNERCIDMLSIAYHIIRGEHAKAFECIDRVEAAVGGDPYLHILRLNVHLAAKDFPAAVRSAAAALEKEPELEEGCWTVAIAAANEKRFDDVSAALQAIRTRLGLQPDAVAAVPELAEFVKSPQYAAWLKLAAP